MKREAGEAGWRGENEARMIGRCVQQMVDWGRKKGTRVKERQGTLTLGRSRSILAEPCICLC